LAVAISYTVDLRRLNGCKEALKEYLIFEIKYSEDCWDLVSVETGLAQRANDLRK
jgi:hypothetical protein